MQIIWQSHKTETATLAWGGDATYGSGEVASSEMNADHQHVVPLTGLVPGTRYFYRIAVPEGTVAGSFVTAPEADAQRVKFFIFGDTRSNPARLDVLSRRMLAACANDPGWQGMALLTGDLSSDGNQERSWDSEFFAANCAGTRHFLAEIPLLAVMGNHEGAGTLFQKYFPYPYVARRYWSFDYGPAHVILADQYTTGTEGVIDVAQRAWIEADLAASNKPWKFIVLHHPGWAAGGHGPSTDVQQNIQPLAKSSNALVIAGHNHYYARAVVDGVQHITTGGGGAPLYDPAPGSPNVVTIDKSHHFCTIEIEGNTLIFKVIRDDGSLIESVYLTR